jgi:arylsulfatase A-like enzyme
MEKPNVLLITIDALRFDHLGCYGYLPDISPSMDSLASKGALFLKAISNGGRTPDSFPSILASRPPPLSEKEYGLVMQRNTNLPGLLKEAGYHTAAFHSNPFLSKFFHYDKGFDVFKDDLGPLDRARKRKIRMERPQGVLIKPSFWVRALHMAGSIFNYILFSFGGQRDVTAKKLTNRAISWLDTWPDSFFLWIHYMDVHYPYLPPRKYARKFCKRYVSPHRMSTLYHKLIRNLKNSKRLSPAEIDTLINLYDANIRYVDDNIGRLLDSLGSRLENTLIIVTADHGETFGEHGTLGHETVLYDEVIHVPLIMVGPGVKTDTIVGQPVELIGLSPTIVDLVGISSVKDFRGESLLPVMRGGQFMDRGVISTRVFPRHGERGLAYRTSDWKYIRTESLDELNTLISEEVYNLRDDPKERNNLCGSEDREAKAFELEAVDKILEFKQLKREEETAYEKERIRSRLKKLPKL